MRRIKRARPSAAIIVAVVALIAALGSGAVAGVTISKLNKKERNQVKKIAERKAKRLDRKIELLPGPKGEQGDPGARGEKGDPGESATKLFAYIRHFDEGPEVEYGSGVTGVDQPFAPTSQTYRVTFNRSLVGCAVDVTVGEGNPRTLPTVSSVGPISPKVNMSGGADDQVDVNLLLFNGAAGISPFLITAFC